MTFNFQVNKSDVDQLVVACQTFIFSFLYNVISRLFLDSSFNISLVFLILIV